MVESWLAALQERHFANLTFSEVARALRALSTTYVEKRERLTRKSALDSAGKQAAYALYYSPLHLLTARAIVQSLRAPAYGARHVLDIGCGAGAASAAWATAMSPLPAVTGVDTHPWALGEAAFTYRHFGLRGDTRRADLARFTLPRHVDAVIAGWVLNELREDARAVMQRELLSAAKRGVQVLVIEPISTRVSPWWRDWAQLFVEAGGRADEWRFPVVLPDLLRRFDQAAGLRHEELTARSLWVGLPERQTPAPDSP